jgi:hypothetical protein
LVQKISKTVRSTPQRIFYAVLATSILTTGVVAISVSNGAGGGACLGSGNHRVLTQGNEVIEIFSTNGTSTGSCTFTVPNNVYALNYLVVGGGGGGASGGGGGGGVVTSWNTRWHNDVESTSKSVPLSVTPNQFINVQIGAGGTHGVGGSQRCDLNNPPVTNNRGQNTSYFGNCLESFGYLYVQSTKGGDSYFGSIVARGGGAGGGGDGYGQGLPGTEGGSGGGAAFDVTAQSSSSSQSSIPGSNVFGNKGGGNSGVGYYGGAGGGGAGKKSVVYQPNSAGGSIYGGDINGGIGATARKLPTNGGNTGFGEDQQGQHFALDASGNYYYVDASGSPQTEELYAQYVTYKDSQTGDVFTPQIINGYPNYDDNYYPIFHDSSGRTAYLQFTNSNPEYWDINGGITHLDETRTIYVDINGNPDTPLQDIFESDVPVYGSADGSTIYQPNLDSGGFIIYADRYGSIIPNDSNGTLLTTSIPIYANFDWGDFQPGGGYGGAGIKSNITGEYVEYGCGGGGGINNNTGFVVPNGGGQGGCSGAGNGSSFGTFVNNNGSFFAFGLGTDGADGTGGGGGGTDPEDMVAGNGGSGLVVIRYLIEDLHCPYDPNYQNTSGGPIACPAVLIVPADGVGRSIGLGAPPISYTDVSLYPLITFNSSLHGLDLSVSGETATVSAASDSPLIGGSYPIPYTITQNGNTSSSYLLVTITDTGTSVPISLPIDPRSTFVNLPTIPLGGDEEKVTTVCLIANPDIYPTKETFTVNNTNPSVHVEAEPNGISLTGANGAVQAQIPNIRIEKSASDLFLLPNVSPRSITFNVLSPQNNGGSRCGAGAQHTIQIQPYGLSLTLNQPSIDLGHHT